MVCFMHSIPLLARRFGAEEYWLLCLFKTISVFRLLRQSYFPLLQICQYCFFWNTIGFFYSPDHQVALGMQQLLDQMTPFSVERSTQTANFTWKEKLLLQRKQQNKFGHSSSWREVRLQQQEIQAYINYTRRRRQSWNSVTLQTLLEMYSLLPI